MSGIPLDEILAISYLQSANRLLTKTPIREICEWRFNPEDHSFRKPLPDFSEHGCMLRLDQDLTLSVEPFEFDCPPQTLRFSGASNTSSNPFEMVVWEDKEEDSFAEFGVKVEPQPILCSLLLRHEQLEEARDCIKRDCNNPFAAPPSIRDGDIELTPNKNGRAYSVETNGLLERGCQIEVTDEGVMIAFNP